MKNSATIFMVTLILVGMFIVAFDIKPIKASGSGKNLTVATTELPPVATLTFKPAMPFVFETVTFNATNSYDPDGYIVSYKWDFGDGQTATGTIVTHVYDTDGTYVVALTVTDNSTLTDTIDCSVMIRATQEGCGRPVLIAPVIIFSESSEVGYIVGATLSASFKIRNDGNAVIKLDTLCLGGRFNGGTLPGGGFPDFTFRTVTLPIGGSYDYSGQLVLTDVGDYQFFVAYYIANPTDAEKQLLDPNNWNTCIDLGPGMTDSDRTGSVQPIDLPLATRATRFVKAMIGADYYWGANGWNWSTSGWAGGKFMSSQEIRSGPYYYCNKDGYHWGYGLDCSGLVYWAYNKAYAATTYAPKEAWEEVKTGTTTTGFVFPHNPVAFTNAHQQYVYNVQQMDKTTTKADLLPGDLIFFDNTPPNGWIDHVAMYIGDYSYPGGTIKGTYYPPGTYDCAEAFNPGVGIVPRILETKEFTWTENGIVKTKTVVGLKTRASFTNLAKPFGRVRPADLPVNNAKTFEIFPKSPVTLKVTDPLGLVVSENVSEAPDMIYLEYDADEDGEVEDVIVVLEPMMGDYIIETIPKPDALPEDTYSLQLLTNSSTVTLAQNVSISDIPPYPYIVTANETVVTPRLDAHDIGVTSFTSLRTVIGQNFVLPSTLSIFNYGNSTEFFNVTVYADAAIIASFTSVSLAPRNSATLNFSWNTAGFDKGNYTITVVADPVTGETYTVDNNVIGGWILVTIPGDVDGDRDVDIFDLVRMAGGYGTEPPNPKYNVNCDIDGDGDIDIFDLVIAAGRYGQSW